MKAGLQCAWRLGITSALLGCGAGHDPPSSPPAAPLRAEAGFVEVAPEDYELGGEALESSATALFYTLEPAHPALEDPPLFVVSGGGPAGAVSFLSALGTGPQRIVEEPDGTVVVRENPHGLARLGHVLHIDARGAGFSCLLARDARDPLVRAAEFAPGNFNFYRDAADVLSALLTIIAEHPELEARQLVFVSESYGGMRVAAMLSMLVFHERHVAGSLGWRFPALAAKVEEHLARSVGGPPYPPERTVAGIRGAVLLQPLLAGTRQRALTGELLELADSPLYAIAAETGREYLPCSAQSVPCAAYDNAERYLASVGRSRYDYAAPASWLDQHLWRVAQASTQLDALAAFTGLASADLGAALAARPAGAFRAVELANEPWHDDGDLQERIGPLAEHDAYFLPLGQGAFEAHYAHEVAALGAGPASDVPGRLLLDAMRHVPAFVSRAGHDLAVYGPALPPLLAGYGEEIATAAATSREIALEFQDGERVTLLSPEYPEASHSVLEEALEEVSGDVEEFLAIHAERRP